MATAAILDYRKLDFWTARHVGIVVLQPHNKFVGNRLNRSQFIAVKAKSKLAAAAILDFRKLNFWTTRHVGTFQ
jgi:hypothetical protein